jgi:hypothetical protein
LNSFDIRQDVYDQIVDIFRSENSTPIFLPIDLPGETRDGGQPSSLDIARMGRFVSAKDVFWHDPTGLFNKYKSTSLRSPPRFLKPLYSDAGSGANRNNQLKNIFLDQMGVKCAPNLEDYVELLGHMALLSSMEKSPFGYEESVADVFKLYEAIVDTCVEMSSGGNVQQRQQLTNDDTAIVQVIHVEESVRGYLIGLLTGKPFLPCFGRKWLEINKLDSSPPILIDSNFDLAEKFAEKLNVVVIKPVKCADETSEFFETCCNSEGLGDKLVYFFHSCLRLATFSSVLMLDLENITESLREAPDVQNTCRKMLPFIQSFLHHRKEFEFIYKQLTSEHVNMKDNLLKLKFYRYESISIQILDTVLNFEFWIFLT